MGSFTRGRGGGTGTDLCRRLGGLRGQSVRVRTISPHTGIRSSDISSCSELLYRLRFPAHTETSVICFQWLRTTSACVEHCKDSDDDLLNNDAEPQLNFNIVKLTVGLGDYIFHSVRIAVNLVYILKLQFVRG